MFDSAPALSATRMSSRRGAWDVPLRVFIYGGLAILSLVMLFPLFWLLSSAFKPLGETLLWPPRLLPIQFRPQNFIEAWQMSHFTRVLFNSGVVTVATTVLSVLVNSMAGYGFAKFRFPGRNILFALVLGTLMVPFQVIMVPLFFILRDLDWLNTYHGLVMPRVADAFGIFLMRQFIQSIPSELTEAARIDGASELTIFWRIVLPLCKPAIAVLAIFTFMWRWNDLLWPLVAVTSQDMYTVQLALANFQREYFVEWHYLMALTAVSVLPIMALFLRFQRYFVAGITLSGLKG